MIGLVLCGGLSTRMGTDKGLLMYHHLTWAELAFDKLQSLDIHTVVSINKEQSSSYSELFQDLLIDDISLSVKGPLLGLLSAHEKFPDEDLLVLACDMLEINRGLLEELHLAQSKIFHEACVFLVDGKPQPLCGIYTASGLQKILSWHQQEQLQKFSMMHILDLLDTNYIQVAPQQWQFFKNYNSKDDVEKTKV